MTAEVVPAAVIGAGPYGLAATAHLRAEQVQTHVFGEPLEYWRKHMPPGMHLKSSWTASSISSPQRRLSVSAYERHLGRPLARPIPLDDFIAYGQWFQTSVAADIDSRRVLQIEVAPGGFELTLSDGERFLASRVVLATGLEAFAHRPSEFATLPSEAVSHTADGLHPDAFAGKRLIVVGAGQSAIESAVLAHEAGAHVQVLVRKPAVHWLTRKARLDAGPARRLYAPSDVGPPGLSWVVSFPDLMRRLPLETRRRMAVRCLIPAVTSWLLDRADGIEFICGRRVISATTNEQGAARLNLDDGSRLEADHVMLGTGFRPQLSALRLLAPELQALIQQRDGYPVLGEGFTTSVPGLHVIGALAVDSFGPVMRFVAGTWYAGPALARHIAAAPVPERALASAPASATPAPPSSPSPAVSRVGAR